MKRVLATLCNSCSKQQVGKIPSLFVLRHQVTYRVVQVTDDPLEASADGPGAVSVVSTAAFAGTPQAVAQVSKQERGIVAGAVGRLGVNVELICTSAVATISSNENTF